MEIDSVILSAAFMDRILAKVKKLPTPFKSLLSMKIRNKKQMHFYKRIMVLRTMMVHRFAIQSYCLIICLL